jgi:hypothetical protein
MLLSGTRVGSTLARSLVSLGALLVGLSFAASVEAAPPSREEVQVCTQSYEQGQRQRKKGSLLEAKRELSRCANEACPPTLASDCLKWLGEVESALPSIVVAVVDPEGRDIVDARATIDDSQAGDLGLGRAFDVDPGTHRVRASVRVPQQTPVEQTIVVREGEKRRPVRIVVGTSAKPQSSDTPQSDRRGRGALPYLLLGVGGLSLGAAAGFGIYGLAQKSILDACKPECESDRVDTTNRAFLASDVFLALGLVATGIGAYLFFTQPSAPTQAVLR